MTQSLPIHPIIALKAIGNGWGDVGSFVAVRLVDAFQPETGQGAQHEEKIDGHQCVRGVEME